MSRSSRKHLAETPPFVQLRDGTCRYGGSPPPAEGPTRAVSSSGSNLDPLAALRACFKLPTVAAERVADEPAMAQAPLDL